MFAITNAADFLAFVQTNLAAVDEDIADTGRALNCILSAYHLHEWVWARSLKDRAPLQLGGKTVRTKQDFVAWVETACDRVPASGVTAVWPS